jgi:hypothetical protein
MKDYKIVITGKSDNKIELGYVDLNNIGLEYSIKNTNDEYELILKNTGNKSFNGIVHIELKFEEKETKFFMPAFMYNRNRGNVSPYVNSQGMIGLFPRMGKAPQVRPWSDYWMVRADRLSHPVSIAYSGDKVYAISGLPMSEQASIFNGFSATLGEKESAVGYTLGYENAPWLYVELRTLLERNSGTIKIEAGGMNICRKVDTHHI